MFQLWRKRIWGPESLSHPRCRNYLLVWVQDKTEARAMSTESLGVWITGAGSGTWQRLYEGLLLAFHTSGGQKSMSFCRHQGWRRPTVILLNLLWKSTLSSGRRIWRKGQGWLFQGGQQPPTVLREQKLQQVSLSWPSQLILETSPFHFVTFEYEWQPCSDVTLFLWLLHSNTQKSIFTL